AGKAVVEPHPVDATNDTIYDLGSLTKPLVTAFLYLTAGRDLGLSLDEPAYRILPELDRLGKKEITIRHLLTHTSGMPAWLPLYLRGTTIAEYLRQLRDCPLQARPGDRVVYSCPGYILLGEILQRCATEALDRLAREQILDPLGLSSTGYRPPEDWLPRVAATEDSCEYERKLAGPDAAGYGGFRRGIIRGEVHDQNAWAVGGVAGNSGLFSTAAETARLAMEYMGTGSGLLDDESLRLARTDQTPGRDEARSIAFRISSRGETAAGPDLSREAFGHNGFPGTSLWVDPSRQRAYVLLTNRVHPRVIEGSDMLPLRGRFHTLASRI
ncbi:MAG: serine hydrolase domain-containing protein, partial [Acidobacteriota bacterium]